MFNTRRQKDAVADRPNPWKVPTHTVAPEGVKRRPSRGGFLLGVLSSAALVAMFLAIGSSASAANTSNWKLGYYTTSGRALSMSSVTATPPAVAAFNFTNQDNTALLVTTQGANKDAALGNDNSRTMTASYTISGVTEPTATTFTYYGEPDACVAPNANVRLFFETGGKFAYTNFWWSDSAWQILANGTGFTLTATVDASQAWSDWNGKPSSANQAAFTAAASDVTLIGLSFGGGCGFENGVGTTDGSGTFTLDTFSLTP